jgi:hypothetical protein
MMTLTFMINIMPDTFIGMMKENRLIQDSVLHNFQPLAECAII